MVDSIGSASDALGIRSDVVFFGRPYFTADTAGFALVRAGARSVEVAFEREYLDPPSVNATVSLEESVQAASAAEAVFAQDIRHLVTGASVRGFTILLDKPAPSDLRFSWTAFAVKGAKTFESEASDSSEETVQPAPLEVPASPDSPQTESPEPEVVSVPERAPELEPGAEPEQIFVPQEEVPPLETISETAGEASEDDAHEEPLPL